MILTGDPWTADRCNERGVAEAKRGRHAAAIAWYRRAIARAPVDPSPRYNLALAHHRLGDLQAAEAHYRTALAIDPRLVAARNNLGRLLEESDRLDEALRCFREAVALDPRQVDVLANLGWALVRRGAPGEAIAVFERALALEPEHCHARRGRGHALLLAGDLKQGFAESDWYVGLEGGSRGEPDPRWRDSLRGKTVVLHSRAPAGDIIQFIRYARQVRQRGARVVVECPRSLVRLLSSCPDVDEVRTPGDGRPRADLTTALLSLPTVLGTCPQTVPAAVPYLRAERRRTARWRKRVAGRRGLKVGICWQTSPLHRLHSERSFELKRFLRHVRQTQVSLFGLQRGFGREQLRSLGPEDPVVDLGGELDLDGHAFLDTAGVIESLDLVIGADTAIVHLAGALAAAVWVLLPHVPDWRWGLSGSRSPWYPSTRLFRQRRAGDWESVFRHVARALETRAGTEAAVAAD